MLLKNSKQKRRGSHTVECAVVYPVTFFIFFATLIGGMGVFRYQQIAHLAREAARYASTHGGQYQQENDAAINAGTLPSVTASYITTNIVNAQATWMDPSLLGVTINFNQPGGSASWDNTVNRWPSSPYTDPNTGAPYSVTNTVSVTISYTWTPGLPLLGSYTLQSTSVMPMCY